MMARDFCRRKRRLVAQGALGTFVNVAMTAAATKTATCTTSSTSSQVSEYFSGSAALFPALSSRTDSTGASDISSFMSQC
jgi:hypothetical protein